MVAFGNGGSWQGKYRHVLACPLVGMIGFTPEPGSVPVVCRGCEQEVWLGPRQQELRKKAGGQTYCMPCTVFLFQNAPIMVLDGSE